VLFIKKYTVPKTSSLLLIIAHRLTSLRSQFDLIIIIRHLLSSCQSYLVTKFWSYELWNIKIHNI